MSKVKTRKSSSSHLSHLVGTGSQLPVAELPTARDILRLGVLLREQATADRRNYTMDTLISDLIDPVTSQWEKANCLFKPPIANHKNTIRAKLKSLWERAINVASGRAKLAEKDKFMEGLDKLVDILNCKCKIQLCSEVSCQKQCVGGVHIECKCPREVKIPPLELAFIKAQREKTGKHSTLQIGQVDVSESARLCMSAEKKKTVKEAEDKKKQRPMNKVC